MILKEQNLLFFTRTMGLGGTENVVLQLCEIFKPLVNNVVVCSQGGINVNKLQQMGIKHYNIGDPEKKDPFNILNNCRILRDIVKKERVTVIHTHHRMAAFYVKITGLYRSCMFINTSHNTFTNKKILTRIAFKNANLIACGEKVKNNLTDFFGLDNVSVIHNAVKPFVGEVVVDDRLQSAKNDGKFLIGNIGRLSEQKGMEYFIESIPLILKKHPETQFFIVGMGESEEKLRRMSKGFPVSFLGYRDDVQNIMSQLDLVVLSSLWEGLPLTPIEAFSVGKTIVATGVDGTLEVVNDKVNGLIVGVKNPVDLAEKVCWVISHPEEKTKMEFEAQKKYLNDFSFDALANSYIDYYKGL